MNLRDTPKKFKNHLNQAKKRFSRNFAKAFRRAKANPKRVWRDFLGFWTAQRLYYTISAVAVLVIAPLLVLFLEYRQRLGDWDKVVHFVTHAPEVFRYTCLIMLLILLALTVLLRSVLKGTAVLLATILIFMYAHTNKILAREIPLLPEDLRMASEMRALTNMVDVWQLTLTVVAMVVVLLGAWLLQKRINRKLELPRRSTKKVLAYRLIVFLVCYLGMMMLAKPIMSINDQRTYVPWLDSELVAWNQAENYKRNGFLVGYIYNLGSKDMKRPDGLEDYSEATIRRIVEKYQIIALEANAGKLSLAGEDINILYVMNESFTDPNRIKDIYPFIGDNPIKNLEQIRENPHTASGFVQGAEYGGGTANIEFEALTGLSNYYLGVVPYTHIMSKKTEFPSLPRFLKTQGFATTGLHPFSGGMYKRDIVYHNLGFDKFLDKDRFSFRATEPNTNNYVSDSAAYQEVMVHLGEPGNQFASLVTMQNHMPYWDIYDRPDFESIADVDLGTNAAISNYLQVLSSSDAALGELIAAIDQSERQTVLVFWGDHLPGLYSQLDGTALKYQTPLFIYANFEVAADSEVATSRDLGVISPNYISLALLEYLNAEQPDYYYLLGAVKASVAALSKSNYGTDRPAETEALRDYEIIQYDMLSGKRYAEKLGLFGL